MNQTILLCASTTTFTFQVSFAVIYTHTHTHLHTPTHTLIYIPTTTTNHCVCSSEDRRLNKIKFDNQHYALQLFLFGLHHIALITHTNKSKIDQKETF